MSKSRIIFGEILSRAHGHFGQQIRSRSLPSSLIIIYYNYYIVYYNKYRFQWPRGLRRGSTATRFLGLPVRIPPGAWMTVYFECCVLSGRGICDGSITHSEESYRVGFA